MTAQIIDGTAVAAKAYDRIQADVEEFTRLYGRAPIAAVACHRVGGQQAFADRRGADVAVRLMVRGLDR